MALVCTVSSSPHNCGHRVLTVNGQTVHVHEDDLQGVMTTEELTQLCVLAVKHQGLTFAQLQGRVVVGAEATNVKTVDLIGPGAAITKTNIGTAWTDVCPGANGQRVLVDFSEGHTEFRLIATVNLVGTGPFGLRVVRDSDSAVVYENAAIAQTGERELDTDWQTIPVGVRGSLQLLRVQAKSATAADDPVFRRVTLVVR